MGQEEIKTTKEAEQTVDRLVSNSETSIKVGVIGIGNGGSQVALAASKAGYNTLVMNTSVKDLSDEVLSSDMKALKIGDGRGSGKDRDNAMALLQMRGNDGLRDILQNPHFKAVVNPADVVFVNFSAGGGSGSGIGPFMSGLIHKAYKNKLVIPYAIVPKLSESVLAQANTIACVDEMAALGLPYMLADLDAFANDPMEIAYAKIAAHMVDVMNVIRGDYLHISAAGMADERDVMTVISEPGYMAVHAVRGITENDLAEKTLQGYLIDKIKRSGTVKPQKDKLIGYNLIIANVNSAIEDPLKVGDYAELNSFIGEPKATFGNYAIDDSRAEVEVISVMSGLTLPMDRFIAPRAKVKENKDRYDQQSALTLSKDRELVTFKKDDSTRSVIMGSQSSGEADLSFLN